MLTIKCKFLFHLSCKWTRFWENFSLFSWNGVISHNGKSCLKLFYLYSWLSIRGLFSKSQDSKISGNAWIYFMCIFHFYVTWTKLYGNAFIFNFIIYIYIDILYIHIIIWQKSCGILVIYFVTIIYIILR